ncbi:hypothetical protein Nepgr_011115 [Nepenthes gracilis]|uniref:Uncharacterized protein n=1 Tax=Nepenthes gracilis TaxID=150966 RepID=A0AAD3SEN0_NEPGR|nr:hypothetical protein Nepgr_011115 [Nepenthes gracilis]
MDYRLPIATRTRSRWHFIYKEYFEKKKKSNSNGGSSAAEKGRKLIVIDEEKGSLNLGFDGYLESESFNNCNDRHDEDVEVDKRELHGEGVGSVSSVGGDNLSSKTPEATEFKDAIGNESGSAHCLGGGETLGLEKGKTSELASAKIVAVSDDGRREKGHTSKVSANEIDSVGGKNGVANGNFDDDDGGGGDDDEVQVIGESWFSHDDGDIYCPPTTDLESSDSDDVDEALSWSRFRRITHAKEPCVQRGTGGNDSSKNEGGERKVSCKKSSNENVMTEKIMGGGFCGRNGRMNRAICTDNRDEEDEEINVTGGRFRGKYNSLISSRKDKNMASVKLYVIDPSSEEDNGDDETDYKVNKSADSVSFELSSSDSDEKGSIDNENRKERISDYGLKMRKAHGLVVLVNDESESYEEDSCGAILQQNCVAHRTRSHYQSAFWKQELKLSGTISHPICINNDELVLSSSEYDDDEQQLQQYYRKVKEKDPKENGVVTAEVNYAANFNSSSDGDQKRGHKTRRELEMSLKKCNCVACCTGPQCQSVFPKAHHTDMINMSSNGVRKRGHYSQRHPEMTLKKCNCVARHTRSQCQSTVPKQEPKSEQTIHHPFCIDKDQVHSSSEYGDNHQQQPLPQQQYSKVEEKDIDDNGSLDNEAHHADMINMSSNCVRKRGQNTQRHSEVTLKKCNCVARRTRSQCQSAVLKQESKSERTIHHPFCIDEDLVHSSSEYGDNHRQQPLPQQQYSKVEEKDIDGNGSLDNEAHHIDKINMSGNGVQKRDHKTRRELVMTLKKCNCVACCTRSHCQSAVPKQGPKPFRTISHPFCIDKELVQSSSEYGDGHQPPLPQKHYSKVEEKDIADNDDLDADARPIDKISKSTNGVRKRGHKCSNGVLKIGHKSQRCLEMPLKRRCILELKDYDVHRILTNSVLEEGQSSLEELNYSKNESPERERQLSMEETDLPLRFTFGVEEEVELSEKSELDEETDLWKELELGLASSEFASSDSFMANDGEAMHPEMTIDQLSLCHQGMHHLVLDEEIGIRCRFCSYVNLEMKHVMSPFSEHPFGRSGWRNYGRVNHTVLDDHRFQDLCCDPHDSSHESSIHSKGTVWDIIPSIKQGMYPHQQEGFEFLWKNIAGATKLDELSRPTKLGCGGCILSHAPGTGKSRLTIVFLQTYMKLYKKCRPVIIAPCNMLLTWEEEFLKWNVGLPFHNLNNPELSGKEEGRVLSLLRKSPDLRTIRLAKLYSWEKNESILGISYRLFEQLAGERITANSGDSKEKKREVLLHVENQKIRKMLLELPGLLVLDEGHIPRNEDSLIFRALLRVETKRFIILSGTPFQNSLGELYNTICLVRPQFLEIFSGNNSRHLPDKQARRRAKKAKRAFLRGLTNDNDLEELRARIKPFVHIHKGNILQKTLPGLRDFVVVLRPSSLQSKLLQHCQESYKKNLTLDYRVSLVSLHPWLACKFLQEKEADFFSSAALGKLKGDINAGVKTRFVMELIRLSNALDEKVLVFSQFIEPLSFIRDMLESCLDWCIGQEMLLMSGVLEEKQRQSVMSSFNDPASTVRILLASTRACSEGISLVGASRVILLDTLWNPSVERQAIGRAYRIGQKKVVHVYHLITSGTHEGEKHGCQIEKERLSELVFSSANREDEEPKISAQVSEDKLLEEMVQPEKLKCIFEKIYPLGANSNWIESFGWVNT